MFLLSLLVFTNLFLIPILFHPFSICRHFIHIGHEPFYPKSLKRNTYELYLYNSIERSKMYLSKSSFTKQENLFKRSLNLIFNKHSNIPKENFYPNLITYTQMYMSNNDLSPFTHSFIMMYLSYFILTYFSSLVHVYRMYWTKRQKTLNDVRCRAKQLIELSYGKWILNALFWKFAGIILSHIFYVMSIKISMQNLFISYESIHVKSEFIYSSWNLKKNIEIIRKYEGWSTLYSGILSRTIYELGITLLPRLIWWPFRALFIDSTIKSYFLASSIELYFIQCLLENVIRCFSIYLQIFARITTLEIVNQMHELINKQKYPLLLLLRHNYIHLPWSFFMSMNLIDAKLIRKGLSIFLRQAN